MLISDTHGRYECLPPLPAGDILIHAGDLTSHGRLKDLEEVNRFFASQPHAHKIAIAGNLDFCCEGAREHVKRIFTAAQYLEAESVELCGLHIYGSPWTPRFLNLAFNLDRGAPLAAVWAKIPADVDVLVTHTPPHGILDRTSRGIEAGCEELKLRVIELTPKLHVFGHIHEAYGQIRTHATLFVNAAMPGPGGRFNAPVVVDLPS